MAGNRERRWVRFGIFELDVETREVRKEGKPVRLQPQPGRVLGALISHPGELVTRQELKDKLWDSATFVDFEQGLNFCIRQIRIALDDSAETPRFIETVPRKGYRFIAPVSGSGDAEAIAGFPTRESAAEIPNPPRRMKIVPGLAAAVTLVLAVIAGVKLWWRPAALSVAPQIHALAVLPLQNLSADPEQAYFSDGMTDGLITDLAQMGSLKVISRTSSMQYRQTKKSLPEIARQLGVDGIVEGTIQRSGTRVRITVQLIEAFTDQHLWANTYEGELGDTFQLEKHVAEDVANQVLVRVAARNQSSASTPSRVVDARALDEYLQGTYDLNRFSRGSGDEELKLAVDHFQRAIEIDQKFALAYLGLANAHKLKIQSSNEDMQLATQFVQRALQLDPTLSAGWVLLGDLKEGAWSWNEAEADFRRAIVLNPNDAWAHDYLADLLDILGKPDEGWKEFEIAQELDPDQDHIVYALFKRREYDRGIQEILRSLTKDPNDGYAHSKLFELYAAKGLYKEAIGELQQTIKLFGYADVAVKVGNTYATSGYTAAMREYAKVLAHLQSTKQAFMPINIAAAYTATGDNDLAFYWLEEGYRQRGHLSAGVDFDQVGVYPPLDPLHSDPRFTNLLQRMGLPAARIDAPGRSQEKMDKASVNP